MRIVFRQRPNCGCRGLRRQPQPRRSSTRTERGCRCAAIHGTHRTGLYSTAVANLIVWVILAASVALSAAPPRVARAATDEGLVARWTFDSSGRDEAGRAEDLLTPRNARAAKAAARYVSASQVGGVVGRAIALGVRPSDAEYLTAAISPDLKLEAGYTIEAWIQPTGLGVWNRLVLRWGSAPKYAYHLALHDGQVSLYHGQAGGKLAFAEGGRVRTGRWHHVAGVARRNDGEPDKSTLTVYLDGRAVGSARFDGTIAAAAGVGIGVGDSTDIPSAACRFRGYLDEAAIWSRALSADEIGEHHARRGEVLRGLEAELRKRQIARRAAVAGRLAAHGVRRIVFAERHPGRDPQGHYYANFGYSCTDPNTWLHGRDGGRLCSLDVRTGEVGVLVDDPGGAVRDPQVHYDGGKVLFSYRKAGTHHYHLYEIGTDGTGVRQLTDGPWDDIEPTYLPGGDIVFCSTRCKRYIGCWLAPSAVLYRCGADGDRIRMLSSGAFTENTPAVLPDGRVLYTRWEYVNRDPVGFHHLWTINGDGSGQMVYLGNERPGGVFIDARPVPRTDRIVLIHSPGHGRNEHAGRVATATAADGPNGPHAMRHITRSADYRDPWPLSDDAILAARGSSIVLLDSSGRAEVLHTAAAMVHEPRPIVPRPRESRFPSGNDPSRATATLLLTDVYRGRNMAGIKPAAIKKLLVLEELPKPANYHGGGSQPIGHGVTSTLKRLLGTVPVEADGSACFDVPAMRSVYFAALDARGLSVKQMRSFVTVQPGETLGCVGCHEPRTSTPHGAARGRPLALRRPPSRIEPVEGVPDVLDFPRDVQPILDRHCTGCHNHEKRKGGVVLAGDRGPVFSLSYYTLLLHWQVKDTSGEPADGSGRQPGGDRPYAAYSSASPLMQRIGGGHHEVRLTERERRTIRLWLDTGATYAGTYAAYGSGQVGGCWGSNRPVRVMADTWPSTPPAREAVTRRCAGCHGKWLPKHVTDRVPLDSWGDMLSWTRPLSRFSRHRIYNLSRPEKSLALLVPLSREAGGYARGEPKPRQVRENRRRPPGPIVHPVIFRDADDPDYRRILAHLRAAKAKLDEIKRFDMPGFRPTIQYVREMKRYGVLPAAFDAATDPIDVYATDRAYWRSMWHRPVRTERHTK